MSHAEYEQLAAGYVLGALEPDDEHLFQRHLDGCAVCAAGVRDLEDVAGALAYAAPPVEPPPALRASIRRKVGLTARRRAPLALRRRPSGTLIGGIAVAACVAALFALAFWNMSLRNQNAVYRQRVAAFEQAGRLLNDPSAQLVRLASPGGGQGGRVTVLASSPHDRGVMVVEDLPAPPAGRVYELWGIPRGSPPSKAVPATVFRSGAGRLALVPFGLSIQPSMTFAVTVEPGPSGSPHPTREPILVGSSTARA